MIEREIYTNMADEKKVKKNVKKSEKTEKTDKPLTTTESSVSSSVVTPDNSISGTSSPAQMISGPPNETNPNEQETDIIKQDQRQQHSPNTIDESLIIRLPAKSQRPTSPSPTSVISAENIRKTETNAQFSSDFDLQRLEEKAKKAEEAHAAEVKVRKELEALNAKLLAEKTALLDSLSGEKGQLQDFQERCAKMQAQKNDLENQLRVSSIEIIALPF